MFFRLAPVFICYIVFLLATPRVHAAIPLQEKPIDGIDSLQTRIDAANGIQKVDLLNFAEHYIRREEFDKAQGNAEQAHSLSINLKYPKGEAKALLNLGYLHFLKNRVDSSLNCYQRAFAIINSQKIRELLPIAYNYYGLTLWRKSDYFPALQAYKRAAEYAKEMHNNAELGRAYNNIGLIYWKSGDFSECNDYFFRALKIRDDIGEPFDRVITLNNLARFFYETSDYSRCMVYAKRAYEIAKKVNDQYGIGRALSNLGFAHAGLKDYSQAIDALLQSLEIKQRGNDVPGIAFSLSEIGYVYYLRGDFQTALDYYQRALEMRRRINYIYGIADNYRQIALVYISKGDKQQAESYLTQSLDIAQKKDMKDIMKVCFEELAKIKEAKGDFSNALQLYKKYTSLRDTIEGRSKTERISQITNRYENEVREREILELTQMQKIQQLEIDNKNLQIYLLYISLFLGIGFSIYISIKYRSEKKIKQELALSNTTKDKLFSIIAHDLRSPFIGLLGYTEILMEDYKDLPDEMRKQYITNIDRTIKELYKLLEGLLEWARVQSRNQSYKPERLPLKEIVQNTVVLLEQSVANKGIVLQTSIDENATPFADPQMVYSILRNLISNAIKFSDTGKVIAINASATPSSVIITVADNGAGIPKEHLDKLFSPGSKYTTIGTRGEKGTGIGLAIVSEMVKINKGEIKVTSEVGKGSTFTITLPLEV